MSYLDSVKENFKKFTDYLYTSNIKDKYVSEQEFLETEMYKINLKMLNNYSSDLQNAYDYLKLQKDYSTFHYLT
jgi:hypothetical protein